MKPGTTEEEFRSQKAMIWIFLSWLRGFLLNRASPGWAEPLVLRAPLLVGKAARVVWSVAAHYGTLGERPLTASRWFKCGF